ncbi:transmembrane protein 234 homolog [Prorops nasuta]|uniref:transmembrane protein 234 homolog n=1 Tax=Prorops nasuta TaxID=863751 RepID=UPI0034CF2628
MAVTIESVAYLTIVALLWGITNPLIKRGANGLERIESFTLYDQILKEAYFLITNWKYILPFLVNQMGSVIYFLTLGSTDISLAVPLSNTLTFVFTALTGWALGEDIAQKNTYIGMILILLGTSLCCWGKLDHMDTVNS